MDDVTSSFIRMIPSLLAWITGLVLAIKMLRQGGTGPEKLLVAGCSLVLFAVVSRPFVQILLRQWLNQDDLNYISVAATSAAASVPVLIISLAGFICLVIAFWKKFKVGKPEKL